MTKFPILWIAGAALLATGCVSQQTHDEALGHPTSRLLYELVR